MSCEQCGSPEVEIISERGGQESGRFFETWRCENCGARGTITGDAGAPAEQWNRNGAVFDG